MIREVIRASAKRRRPSFALATLIAAFAALGFAAPGALAAYEVTNVAAGPASDLAGANSDFSISFDLAGGQARDLVIHLPPGLVGNPLATTTCTEDQLNADNCPAASAVGTIANNVTILGAVPQTANGIIYNVVPHQGEPARFGFVLNAPPAAKIVLQSPASLRPSDLGLDTTLKNLPQNALVGGLPVPITINGVQLTLKGQVGKPAKGFLRNPTSCGTHTVAIDATDYADETGHGEDTFDTTNCAALPFDPQLSATIKRVGSVNDPVKLSTTISQTATEAGLQTATVILPAQVAANSSVLTKTCPEAAFQAGTCPADTIVGTARAESPLQAQALTGDVALVEPPGGLGGLPLLGVDLRGALALKLKGVISLEAGPPLRSKVTFDGLPDIPISAFTLTFRGGEGGLNSVFCNEPLPSELTFNSSFTSYSGAMTSPTAKAPIDCKAGGGKNGGGRGGKPTAKVKLRGTHSSEPRLKLKLKAGAGRIRSAKVVLPKSLALASGKTFKRGSKVKGARLKHGRRALRLKSNGAGAKRIKGSFSKGAVLAKGGRGSKGKAHFKIRVRDVDGKLTKLSVRAK